MCDVPLALFLRAACFSRCQLMSLICSSDSGRSIVREVTLEVFVRHGSNVSVDAIVARSPMADDDVQYYVFHVPTLSTVSSTGIRAWRPPRGLLGLLLPRANGLNLFFRARRASAAAPPLTPKAQSVLEVVFTTGMRTSPHTSSFTHPSWPLLHPPC